MYAYCNSNPVNYVDNSGNSPIGIAALILLGVAVVFELTSCANNDSSDYEKSITDNINLYDDSTGEYQEGKINVKFSPDNKTNGEPNPSFQIENSADIRSKKDQRIILEYIVESDYYSQEVYGRTVDSMMVEWDAHNKAYSIYRTDQFKHTDFDKNSEGKGYLDYISEKMGW